MYFSLNDTGIPELKKKLSIHLTTRQKTSIEISFTHTIHPHSHP